MALPASPRSIRWDAGGWLLDVTDFPRPTTMLAYQLAHDTDPIGRVEAVILLGRRAGDSLALASLGGAVRGDRFWGVRLRAVDALGALADSAPADTAAAHRARRATLSAALLDASRDSDARVRQRAADALGAFAGAGDVAVRLRELARDDSSLFVRAAAIGSYAAVAPDSALAVARDLVRRDSWTDVERTAALAALGRVDRPGVVELLREYLAPSASRPARTAAIASLVAHATGGHEAETAATIAPLLDADDLFVRQAAADALGRLGQRASLPMLEARRRVEPESRVVNAIDAALRAIGAVGR
jgi:aminopeptidase N